MKRDHKAPARAPVAPKAKTLQQEKADFSAEGAPLPGLVANAPPLIEATPDKPAPPTAQRNAPRASTSKATP